ncbi:polysaccharide pyruvyl transferase family protein [Nocardioides aurantiacus]|uniref:polysaccharide pyruvyl transferase family protein n=1 Tax=Nocardioides aurantiacus TaxID=86796 RepID=UPI00403F7775
MQRVVVTGFYGRDNFGDELFRHVITTVVAPMQPDWRLRFLGPREADPSLGASLLPWVSKTTLTGDRPVSAVARLAGHVVASFWSQTMTLGGGSLLERVSPGLRLQSVLRARVRWLGLGVSIGPFASPADREAVARFLCRFDLIALRDRQSVRIADEMALGDRVRYTGDLAALYRPGPDGAPPQLGMIGFAPCRNGSIDPQEQVRVVLDAVAAFVEVHGHAPRIRVLALNNHPVHGDDEICAAVTAVLRDRGLSVTTHRFAEAGVAATWDLIATVGLMISTRLHGAITAYLSDRPFVLLEYHEKCADFLDDIGQDDRMRESPARHLTPSDHTELAHVVAQDVGVTSLANMRPEAYRVRARRELEQSIVSLPPAQRGVRSPA